MISDSTGGNIRKNLTLKRAVLPSYLTRQSGRIVFIGCMYHIDSWASKVVQATNEGKQAVEGDMF